MFKILTLERIQELRKELCNCNKTFLVFAYHAPSCPYRDYMRKYWDRLEKEYRPDSETDKAIDNINKILRDMEKLKGEKP